ncbi:MAG: hypothetical protein KDC85_11915 [Saprospiraceae bacterium]|nr:hypothetical protein [Saprospiraceae bacterium]MCB9326208.1 hypothetical protein [Lewinellaceae bacterium]
MRILFVCKASTSIGLGHLIRSRSLANQFLELNPHLDIDFKVVGEALVSRLLTQVTYPVDIVRQEEEVELKETYELCFFDMMEGSDAFFKRLKNNALLTISLSPIFNQMAKVDILFNRTKYHNLQPEEMPGKIYAGLKYTIIQEDCKKIRTSIYEDNLDLDQFPVAISMGGGDAANKTLAFLRSLRNCKVPATFWVMLGEGYQHSYDDLIKVLKKDSDHEIILAKTNRSMWQILRNCILAILPGGITTYEAAYAGLPTINLLQDPSKQYLIQELIDHKVCVYKGDINEEESLALVNKSIENVYYERRELMEMHLNTKNLVGRNSAKLIWDLCREGLEEKA